VDGLVTRIKATVEGECPVVATGGLADLMEEAAVTINVVEPDLTLIGLAEIYRLNP
jgi:type III pantothenate kinase